MCKLRFNEIISNINFFQTANAIDILKNGKEIKSFNSLNTNWQKVHLHIKKIEIVVFMTKIAKFIPISRGGINQPAVLYTIIFFSIHFHMSDVYPSPVEKPKMLA